MSTRAITFLKKKGISFSVVEYDHKEKGAQFASDAIGFPIEKTIKTLVLDAGSKGYLLALMPGNKQLSTRKLSRVSSVKRVEMADTATAERITGYLVGGISPFGTKQKMPVVMEQSLLEFDTVAINAGRRGMMLLLNPKDVVRAVDAKVGELCGE